MKERTSLGNTIHGLLKLHGIRELNPRSPKFAAELAGVRTAFGTPLPPGLRDEVESTHERLVKVMEQLADVEEKKAALDRGGGSSGAITGSVS